MGFSILARNGLYSLMICWLLLVPAGVPVLVSLLLLSSFFPQERGSVPSWFAGSSWFRLGFRCLSPLFSLLWFRCLSPFFSLLSFLRKEVLFHPDLLVPPGSGWGSCACLPYSLFFGSLLVSLLLSSVSPQERGSVPSWFAGSSWFRLLVSLLSSLFPVLASLLLSSFFPQERGSVPSWFAGSSWFWLGFRCLSPLLLSSLFPVLASLLLSSFFPQERGSVPSWFAGSSWFRLGFRCLSPFFLLWFRCLSPFFSLLSFLRKGVLFHNDLLVPPGCGWGSGACLPSSLFFLSSGKGFCMVLFHLDLLVPLASGCGSGACLPSSLFFLSSGKGFCSIMICWFLLVPAGVPVLVSLLLSSLVPVLVSLILSSFFPQERGSVPSWFAGSSWFRLGFRCLSPFSLLWFRCLSPFFSLLSFLRKKRFCSIMICWFLLVPAGVSVLVSLILSSLFPVLVSLLLSSFFPQERGSVPSWFAGSSWFRLGFLCLSPFFSLHSFLRKGVLFHHDLLVPPGSGWGSCACLPYSLFFGSLLVSLLLSSFSPQERGSVPSWFAGSSWFRLVSPSSLFFVSGACLPSSLFFLSSGKGFCSIMICWFLLVPAGLPFFSLLCFRCLPPFFSLLSFLRKGVLFHHDLLVPLGSGWGSGACLPSSLFFLFSGKRVLFHGLVLAPLFSRENNLYQFWTRLKIQDLHSVWIPGCVGASLLLPRICTVEVTKE